MLAVVTEQQESEPIISIKIKFQCCHMIDSRQVCPVDYWATAQFRRQKEIKLEQSQHMNTLCGQDMAQ